IQCAVSHRGRAARGWTRGVHEKRPINTTNEGCAKRVDTRGSCTFSTMSRCHTALSRALLPLALLVLLAGLLTAGPSLAHTQAGSSVAGAAVAPTSTGTLYRASFE